MSHVTMILMPGLKHERPHEKGESAGHRQRQGLLPPGMKEVLMVCRWVGAESSQSRKNITGQRQELSSENCT